LSVETTSLGEDVFLQLNECVAWKCWEQHN